MVRPVCSFRPFTYSRNHYACPPACLPSHDRYRSAMKSVNPGLTGGPATTGSGPLGGCRRFAAAPPPAGKQRRAAPIREAHRWANCPAALACNNSFFRHYCRPWGVPRMRIGGNRDSQPGHNRPRCAFAGADIRSGRSAWRSTLFGL